MHNGNGKREIVICGSTGSIGTQALAIVAGHPDAFSVLGLAAGGSQVELIAAQAVEFNVAHVAVFDSSQIAPIREAINAERRRRCLADIDFTRPDQLSVTGGAQAIEDLASIPVDVVLNGIAGAAGLRATLAALRAGSTLALANKESLIMGGPLVTALAAPGQIVPVDSEHSALAQALLSSRASEVQRLILTASGGPFRGRTKAELAEVTVEQALDHPTWSMGPLVTINSATMINKGLEVIEAQLLFDVPLASIDVVVHPQSVVHSMVEFVDGSTIAQASPPDMRIPIALALDWPHRRDRIASPCDWTRATQWEFFPVDHNVFPALTVARTAARAGGLAPAVFNAADEVAVQAFIDGEVSFLGIVDTVAAVVDTYVAEVAPGESGNEISLDRVLEADRFGRLTATALLG